MIGQKNRGYTIVEVMIFLTVSSVLFISVAVLISGQLGKHQARDAVNQVESVVRGVFSDVGNGYFPEVGQKVSCTIDINGVGTAQLNGISGSNRGTVTNCIIVGKKITFKPSNIEIETLAANSGILSVSSTNIQPIIGLKETKGYKWGMTRSGTNDKTYYVLFSNYSSQTGASGEFLSGYQNITTKDGAFLAVSQANSNNLVCFKNGSNTSSITIADNTQKISSNYVQQDTSKCPA